MSQATGARLTVTGGGIDEIVESLGDIAEELACGDTSGDNWTLETMY